MCTKENFPTPARSVSRYHAILKTRCGFRFCWTFIAFNLHAGYNCRMANVYNLHCIYRLHNLNIQLALLEYERQIRQHRRTERWLTQRLLADQHNYLYLESSLLIIRHRVLHMCGKVIKHYILDFYEMLSFIGAGESMFKPTAQFLVKRFRHV